jgi:Sec-independent protein secretion pathway component TatC
VACNRRRRFLLVLAVVWAGALVAGALLTPPDPVTQAMVVGPVPVLAVPVAWLVATRTRSLA